MHPLHEQISAALEARHPPLPHLDRVHRVVGGDLLECLEAADRLLGDYG
jgi:hypothetical protein